MTTFPIRQVAAAAALVGCAAVASCGPAASATAKSPAGGQPAQTITRDPIVPGDAPSSSATMICQPEAWAEIASALGLQTTTRPTATWSDHVYTCRYEYPTGTIVLSVKELVDAAATNAYVAAAQHSLPTFTKLQVLGLQAFAGPDGSLYVRKDFKVLHVDVSALPGLFGEPPRTHADAAFIVAVVIMSCWTGS